MSRQLFKATATVSSMTMMSRIFGFIRDILLARLFGIDATTDAFFVAFKIPNFLRRLFAEGAFSQAFIPVLADYKAHETPQNLRLFIDKTAGTLVVILLLITIIGVISAPILIVVFAPGFLHEGNQYDLAVHMLRITFPYLFFISLVAFAGSLLNSHGKFAIPAFTPVLLNVCMIVVAIWLAPLMDNPIVALAWGVFIAGVAQLLLQLPVLKRLGLLPRLKFGFKDPGVVRILKLITPAIFGVSITQINLLLDTLLASFLVTGSVSWLYYSDRLVGFPLGIFGIALSTVILPHLSNQHAVNNSPLFSQSLNWALRLVLLIGLPATLGLLMLAEPMLSTLFQYDAFGREDVQQAGQSLMAYALGLLGFILVKVLVTGFTSRQDMKTPVRFGIYAVLMTMSLNIALVFPFAHAGLALATSLGAFFNASLLLTKLIRDKIYKPSNNWANFIVKIIFAGEMMTLFLYIGIDNQQWFMWGALDKAIHLAIWITTAGLVYAVSLLLVGIRPQQFLNQ